MLSNLGLQDIQVRLLPAEMMYRHYIDNTKVRLAASKSVESKLTAKSCTKQSL